MAVGDKDGIPVIYDGSGMIVKKLDMDAGSGSILSTQDGKHPT
jgi:hypothetical protein